MWGLRRGPPSRRARSRPWCRLVSPGVRDEFWTRFRDAFVTESDVAGSPPRASTTCVCPSTPRSCWTPRTACARRPSSSSTTDRLVPDARPVGAPRPARRTRRSDWARTSTTPHRGPRALRWTTATARRPSASGGPRHPVRRRHGVARCDLLNASSLPNQWRTSTRTIWSTSTSS